MVFMQPQRLVVPLFQRPYVWSEEHEWEPLWNDLVRITDRVLTRPSERHHPHFLERTIIDGQKYSRKVATLLQDGQVEVDSVPFSSPPTPPV